MVAAPQRMDNRGDMKRTANPKRTLAWSGLAIGAVIILAGALAATRQEAQFDPGTPEATAQAYFVALFDGDDRGAHALLTPELRERCGISRLREAWIPDNSRVVLADTWSDGSTADVRLRLTETTTNLPFEVSESSFEVTLTMTRSGDDWRISEVPWPMYACDERITP